MQVKVTDIKTFHPIEMSIVIETEDELKSLWHRMNINQADILDNSNLESMDCPRDTGQVYKFWTELNRIAVILDIKKGWRQRP